MRVVAVSMSFSFVGEVSTRPWQYIVLGFNGAPQLHILRGLTEEVTGGTLDTHPLDISDDALEHPSIEMVEWDEGILCELNPVVNISYEKLPVGIHIVYSLGPPPCSPIVLPGWHGCHDAR